MTGTLNSPPISMCSNSSKIINPISSSRPALPITAPTIIIFNPLPPQSLPSSSELSPRPVW